ncbi:M28 family peptidase [Dyella jiangningensis]|uniref:M20/M25/M40 family metallo-hydrolase n=1 Tax=Dyella jiangningensis TaxID=1379159 RepID=UPI00240EBDE7|nr:M20/M25/M40 family metallo-hydrolase [Dyella jiangningensis]MDG2536110.1 M28 family peptidase [Dyella jiangningensis]
MSRTLLAAVFATTLSATAFAGAASQQQAGLAQIRETDLRADIGFLASDALEGRLSLQPGDDAAVQWIASEFAKAGLKPAATDADGKPSYLQAVPLIEYRPDAKATRLTMKRNGKVVEWKDPDVAGSFPEDRDVDAPLVFAGYGITAPELGYDDYAGLDVKGKIVVVFDHEPQEKNANSVFNGTGNTRYATSYVKILNAQEHGAVAVLLAPEPSHNHPSAQEIRTRIGHHAEHAANPIPAQALADNPVHIPAMVISSAVSEQLLGTSGETPMALQGAIDKDLKPHSEALQDGTISLHLHNSSRREATTWNVVGLVEGSDPKLAPETIIISGHHDHDGQSGDKIWHGADDNASGTVGVVTLARAFAANPAKPKRSILFAVFAAEERGLLGAYYMAVHPLRPLDTTRAMINFDMIGRDEKPSQQTDGLIDVPADTSNRLNLIGAAYSPDYQHTVAKQNEQVGLVLDDRFDHEYALNVFFRSDQFPFVLHNVPAFWWFTGFHPDYHHPSDTAEKIDYPKMAKILKLAYLSAWQFADESTPPRFISHPGRAPGR